MQNLRTHNTVKIELPKRKLAQKPLLSNNRLEAVETGAVSGLVNKKAVQTCFIPLLPELLATQFEPVKDERTAL